MAFSGKGCIDVYHGLVPMHADAVSRQARGGENSGKTPDGSSCLMCNLLTDSSIPSFSQNVHYLIFPF